MIGPSAIWYYSCTHEQTTMRAQTGALCLPRLVGILLQSFSGGPENQEIIIMTRLNCESHNSALRRYCQMSSKINHPLMICLPSHALLHSRTFLFCFWKKLKTQFWEIYAKHLLYWCRFVVNIILLVFISFAENISN